MKSEFKDKTICFLGDSITASGGYVYDLRAYFSGKKEKCFVYNRGIGGNRAVMAPALMKDDVFSINPDYVVISFSANDVGIWLYDTHKETNTETLREREKRDREFYDSFEKIVKILLSEQIVPVLMTPYPANTFFKDKALAETLGDNSEKRDNIVSDFYCRDNMIALNNKFKVYAEKIKEISVKYNIGIIDVFADLSEKIHKTKGEGIFGKDGLHLTQKGHDFVAQSILEFLCCDDIAENFIMTKENDKIREIEQYERSVQFFRWGQYHPIYGEFTKEDIDKFVRNVLCDSKSEKWLINSAKNYIKYSDKLNELRKEIIIKTREL